MKILKKLGEEHERQSLLDETVPSEKIKEFQDDGKIKIA